jgi:HNH endonuclease
MSNIKQTSVIERFNKKYYIDNNGCWIWIAYKDKNGYGIFRDKSSIIRAHRFSYQYYRGKIPKDLELDHVICQNPTCVNPNHLEAVSHKENILRGNSPSALHSKQTHCQNGHALNKDNIYFNKNANSRRCIICRRKNARDRYYRRINLRSF